MSDRDDAKNLTIGPGGMKAGPQFAPAHAKTSAHEAGYANDSKDRGGETWAGIAYASHPNWKGWPLVWAGIAKLGLTGKTRDGGKPMWSAITTLLRADRQLQQLVDELYESTYWIPLGLLPTDFQEWAEYAYDKAVNFGLEPGKHLLATMRKAGA